MASLSSDKNGNRVIQFQREGQGRGTLRLGKIPMSIAQGAGARRGARRRKPNAASRRAAHRRWVSEIGDDLHAKLAALELVASRAGKVTATLGAFLEGYVTSRIDVKPATTTVWHQAIRNMTAHFGAERNIATIHEGDADGFKLYLQSQKLSSVTVFKRLQIARMFFRAVTRQKLTPTNPFAEVSSKAVPRVDRFRFVTRQETDRILAECNPTWRVIVALARYGGLRCPSEVLSVKWSDVNWDTGRLVVTAPKTCAPSRQRRACDSAVPGTESHSV